jgi:hypothetical protein
MKTISNYIERFRVTIIQLVMISVNFLHNMAEISTSTKWIKAMNKEMSSIVKALLLSRNP